MPSRRSAEIVLTAMTGAISLRVNEVEVSAKARSRLHCDQGRRLNLHALAEMERAVTQRSGVESLPAKNVDGEMRFALAKSLNRKGSRSFTCEWAWAALGS